MCGRFTQHLSWSEIVRLLTLNDKKDVGRNTEARYNITPMQTVLFCIFDNDGERTMKEGQWWLVPHWAKEKPKYALFNARSEDVEKKPSFRDAFKSKRCLIPADGFFEWTKNADDGGKDPHYIHLPDHQSFAFAGLWAHNSALDITSCTILTRTPTVNVAHIHNRMPVILEPSVYSNWLDPNNDVATSKAVLDKHVGGDLISYRVGREVNSNRAKGAQLIEQI